MNLLLTSTGNGEATLGTLMVGATTFFTIELPWRDNAPSQSCVPAGTYDLVPYISPKHGPTWCLSNPALGIMGRDTLTEGQIQMGMRSMCELHSGNYARESEGCILVGYADQPMLDNMTGFVVPAVEESVNAFTALRQLLTAGSTGHTLTIARENS